MVALGILVVVLLLVPLMMKAIGSKRRSGPRGIDWSRAISQASKHVMEGARLYDAGDTEGAIAEFDRALALEPDRVDALVARAAARHRAKRLDDALADYDRVIALQGPTCEMLNNRGCVQRDRGDLDRAVTDLEAAVVLEPNDAIANVSLAEALAERGDWDAALASLRRGIAQDATWREHARTAPTLASLRAARPGEALFEP